jgi:ribonuclease-3 family protein
MARAVEDVMTEEEKGYLRRGRNAKSATVPKNADPADYRIATGFEAMLGALYLGEKWDRLNKIIEHCLGMAE